MKNERPGQSGRQLTVCIMETNDRTRIECWFLAAGFTNC